MGQQQSTPGFAGPMVSQDKEKLNFFSTVFSRLIEKSDIIDLKALTSGPGACGNYVMLLSKNIQTDFKKIKLKSGLSDSSLNDFLYSPTQRVLSKTSAKEQACTYLAIFYIRTLQLVAALTMSIYSPPDLISRIAKQAYENALKIEKKSAPKNLSKPLQAQRRQARESWLSRFLKDTEQPGVFIVNDNQQLKYYKTTNTLSFITYNPEPREYRLRLEVKDPDSYPIKDTETYLMTPILAKPDTYWIEITNLYSQLRERECIYRVLVDSTGKCWRFENNPDVHALEEEVTEGPFDKWDYDLESAILGAALPYQAPAKQLNTGFGYDQFSRSRFNQTRRMNSKRNNSTIKNIQPAVVSTPTGLSDKTKLPVQYQITYKTMSKWWESVKLPDWPEAAPASFRATLLYNKPTLPTEYGSTYICDDIWADLKMRTVPPFAALEALYYNRDDGTPDVKNAGLLSSLSQAFNTVYENASQGKSTTARNSTRAIKTFLDVSIPAESTVISSVLCANKSAQGESQINRPEIATILAQAQNDIVAKYKLHVDKAYELLKGLFEIGFVNGDTIIKFTEDFTNSPKGVRTQLEDVIIPNAIILIANHYLEVEEIYYKALNAIANLPLFQRG
jgi:hypothetical protein